ncbi:MAG TPA: GDSL-type esterase/lipase family protein, partial [Planctomycetaceae bacterium]|nr:GDSL-type esterase/lipase family protein [Planctomycetaceae bacterium]
RTHHRTPRMGGRPLRFRRLNEAAVNAITRNAAFFFAAGDAFFAGALLIAAGHLAAWRWRHRRGAKWFRMLTILGIVFGVLAVIPLPWLLYSLCLGLPLMLINRPFATSDDSRRHQILRRVEPLVEFFILLAVGWELWDQTALRPIPSKKLPAEIHVVGDSLSAGIGDEQNHLWPRLLSQRLNVPVVNHAQPGANIHSALKQAEAVTGDDPLVLIEIGGNDLLSNRDSTLVAADLELLLATLPRGWRELVMFELPVPPIPGAYALARTQRRLARRFGVRLIPRRQFAKVLFSNGATIDSLHLSREGHERLANMVAGTLFTKD